MRFNTLFKDAFSGEYWNYTTEQDIDGQLINTYYKEKDITGAVISPEKGNMYLYCNEQLRYNARIYNLRDASGNLVFKQDLTGLAEYAYIGVSEPVFDVTGTIISYRHDLSQGAGT